MGLLTVEEDKALDMETTVSVESLDRLESLRSGSGGSPLWPVPFVLPVWLKAWWEAFGSGWEPCVLNVKTGGNSTGIAPLRIRGQEARFIGEVNVCDYLDFVAEPGREPEFFSILLDHLRKKGVEQLDLRVLRPESAALRFLPGVAESFGCEVNLLQEDVSYELNLPATWEGYLQGLSGHQRHEIRRKFRRLGEAGEVRLRIVEEPGQVRRDLETFLELFRASRPDKAEFMTPPMTRFFRAVAGGLADRGMLRLYLLDLDGRTVASVVCFESGTTTYLYNNGYNPGLGSLSLGTVSKALTIRDCIERGRGVYDFLKGAEPYKKHLGGSPVTLRRCRVRMP